MFEAPGNCTPGGAGRLPSNLAVLTVNSQNRVTKVLLQSLSLPLLGFLEVQSPSQESGEGALGKPQVTSKGKVVLCRS